MPEPSLKDTILTSFSAQEPWPDNVKLYQPYEVEQILLPDNASCLAVQAFLKMSSLPFDVEMRWNAEFMSPSGRVPFIKCGAFVVSELEPIVQFAANKGVSLCARLSSEEKAEMRAYMSLITNVLVNAELYISWLDEETFNTVTKVRNSSVYPWPLSWIQTRSKRNAVIKRLKALNWHDKTLDQVLADVEQCCNSLSQRLGDRDYFFGTPSPLDALVYGHMRALLGWNGPKAPHLIKAITTALLRHTLRMSHLTAMKLTPQEEYLVSQAYNIARLCRSPERTLSERSERSVRTLPSRLRTSRSSVKCEGFGRPFSSRHRMVPSPGYGEPTPPFECEPTRFDHEATLTTMYEIVCEILDKVDDMATIIDAFRSDDEEERNDFEVIKRDFEVVPTETPFVRASDYLDTIDEHEMTEATISIGPEQPMVQTDDEFEKIADGDAQTMNDDSLGALVTADNVNDNDVSEEEVENVDSNETVVDDVDSNEDVVQPFIQSSVNGISETTFTSPPTQKNSKTSVRSGNSKTLMSEEDSSPSIKSRNSKFQLSENNSKATVKSRSSKSLLSTDSNNTLRKSEAEKLSIESLLQSLRKKSPGYVYQLPVDVD